MTTTRFADEARDELLDQIDYYTAENRAVGERFRLAFEAALAQAIAYPEAGSPTWRGTRRVLVRGFPFSVVYRYRDDVITIVAVAHHARRTGYWASRLDRHDP